MTKRDFKPFSENDTYTGTDHAPIKGVPGHGNAVMHKADNDIGRVINSNSKRSLVQFRKRTDWYPNTDLLIGKEYIV